MAWRIPFMAACKREKERREANHGGGLLNITIYWFSSVSGTLCVVVIFSVPRCSTCLAWQFLASIPYAFSKPSVDGGRKRWTRKWCAGRRAATRHTIDARDSLRGPDGTVCPVCHLRRVAFASPSHPSATRPLGDELIIGMPRGEGHNALLM